MEPDTGLVAGVSGLVGVALTALVVPTVRKVDAGLARAVKPVRPLLAGALGIALPLIGRAVGVVDMPAPEIILMAPLGTLLGITARELFKRARHPHDD